jgi:hypothetical protein
MPPTPLLLRNITDNELYLKTDHGRDFSVGSSVTYHIEDGTIEHQKTHPDRLAADSVTQKALALSPAVPTTSSRGYLPVLSDAL